MTSEEYINNAAHAAFMVYYGNMAFHGMHPYGYGYAHPTLIAAAPMAETDAKYPLASNVGQSNRSLDMNTANGCNNTVKVIFAQPECGTSGFGEETGPANEFKAASLKAYSAVTCANLSGGVDQWSVSTPIQLQKQGSIDSELSSNSELKYQSQEGMKANVSSRDDKETKRQRRKQSNRESARRSRLCKQTKCEELSIRVHNLVVENTSLRTELDRLSEECEKLFAENAAIMKHMGQQC